MKKTTQEISQKNNHNTKNCPPGVLVFVEGEDGEDAGARGIRLEGRRLVDLPLEHRIVVVTVLHLDITFVLVTSEYLMNK